MSFLQQWWHTVLYQKDICLYKLTTVLLVIHQNELETDLHNNLYTDVIHNWPNLETTKMSFINECMNCETSVKRNIAHC